MKFTGERYVPDDGWPQIAYEHWHRYLFAAQFVAGRSVLDIACGEGYGSRLLAATAASVLGVDADAESVAHAGAAYPAPNLQFRKGDVTRIPETRGQAFDVVVSFETIEHVGEAEQVAFLREVKRLLKPGGLLLVSTPDKRNYSDKTGAKNSYHRREFYTSEFLAFLGQYFRTVRPLGQKAYSGSLIWPMFDSPAAAAAPSEFQLVYSDGGYRAAPDDRKEPWYIVAACTDAAEIPAASTSVLIDASDRVSVIPVEAVHARDQEVAALRAELERQKAEAARAANSARDDAGRRDVVARELRERLEHHVAATVRAEAAAAQARAEVAELQARLGEARDAAGRLADLRPALHRQSELIDRLLPTMEAMLPRVDRMLQAPYRQMIREVREAARALPPGANVLVASRGDDELLRFDGRQGWHFPQSDDGVYAGHHPADDAEAAAHLEALREKGAGYLLLPATAFWWLDHYDGFREHLKRYRVVHRDGACVIYGLAEVLARPAAAAGADRTGAASPNAAAAAPAGGGAAAAYKELLRQVRHAVRSTVPPNATVLVVSKGDDALLALDGRPAWHFPRREDGVYAGYYPPDSADAITHLEECRARGAEFFVLPNTAFWWLDSYSDFARHLGGKYPLLWRDDLCIVYRLAPGAGAAAGAGAASNAPAAAAPPPAPQPTPVVATKRAEDWLHPNLVTVVVPVYNAFEEVRECLRSLVAHARHPHRVLLIDDRSTDESIWPLLEAYATAHDHVVAVRNDKNLGFTGTVNRGCRLTGGDVVLLNSDTEVTAGWLEKLAACAAGADNVGTVTALSNAAGAFSVPVNNQDNEIPPHLTADEMAALVERLSGWVRPEVPTGNGFCMYVTRRLLREIGLFDEARFPRGYGEENDFCRRAAKAGFVNLIDDRTFVRHKGSASFLGTRAEHLARGLDTLRRLHPGYDALVQEWLRNDPLDPLRASLAGALGAAASGPAGALQRIPENADARPCILYVVHDGEGGTLHMVEDLIRASAEDSRCLLLKTGTDRWTLYEHVAGALRASRRYSFEDPWRLDGGPDADRLAVLREVCRAHAVALAHVNHLIGSGAWLPHALKDLGLPVVFSFHDFYSLCPTIQLLDERGTFCGAKCTSGEGDCNLAANLFQGTRPRLKHGFVHEHRGRMADALQRCDVFVAPSQSTKDVLLDALPLLGRAEFHVIEHGRDVGGYGHKNGKAIGVKNGNGNGSPHGGPKPAAAAPRRGERARVLLLGNLNRAKGTELILKVMALDLEHGPRFEFHFLGLKEPGFNPESLGGIYHGAYERDTLPELVGRIRPSFAMIASVWPETYCYTLTESWAVGLPVFASDVGALRERIRRHGGGWLADHTDPRRWYAMMLTVLDNPREYEEQSGRIARMKVESVATMAARYHQIYDRLLHPPATPAQSTGARLLAAEAPSAD